MSAFDSSFIRVGAESRARPAKAVRQPISLERFLPFLLPVVVIAAWQLGSSIGWISTRIMPSPAAVVAAFWQTTISGQLPNNILVSAGRAFTGLLVGGSIGFLLGIANGVSRLSEQLTDTTLQMLRTIPHLAMVPLVILWFGIRSEERRVGKEC